MANTRITYTGYGNDHHEATVLTGELTLAQIRRLEIGSFLGKLTDLVDELGLARLSHNGNGIRIEVIMPTLEAATNARVDAQGFYARVLPAFARASVGYVGSRQADIEKAIVDRLKGKGVGELLSTKRGMLATQSDQAFVSGWLRSMLANPVSAGAMLSPLNYDLPPASVGNQLDPTMTLGNIHALYLLPVAWATVMGNDPRGAGLQNAMTPDSAVTAGEAAMALQAAKEYSARVKDMVARLPA